MCFNNRVHRTLLLSKGIFNKMMTQLTQPTLPLASSTELAANTLAARYLTLLGALNDSKRSCCNELVCNTLNLFNIVSV